VVCHVKVQCGYRYKTLNQSGYVRWRGGFVPMPACGELVFGPAVVLADGIGLVKASNRLRDDLYTFWPAG